MAASMELLSSFMGDNFISSLNPFSELGNLEQQKNISSRNLKQRKMVKIAPLAAALVAYYNKQMPMEALAKKPLIKLKMTALVTVKISKKVEILDKMLHWFDDSNNSSQKGGVVFQLVSSELDQSTMQPKLSQEALLEWSESSKSKGTKLDTYKVEFMVDSSFGMPGAILVNNNYHEEFFLKTVSIEGVGHFPCNSWVQPQIIDEQKRIFFINKAYLPNETPSGLKFLREMDLRQLRGCAKGIRKSTDRIYDYDVYNDLGNPDRGIEFSRPILGGETYPYPRRCRTGRPANNTDENTESPVNSLLPMYVPRDEAFEESKQKAMDDGKWKFMCKNLIPVIRNIPVKCDTMKRFYEINCVYKKNSNVSGADQSQNFPELLQEIVQFDIPDALSRDGSSFFLRDDEFGRLALAGMNPLSIERLTVFPPVSKLNPSIYGPQESAITEEHISAHLGGMTVQQALEGNKLFILDYHDVYLPFLDRINALDDRKAYATRTIFFLTSSETLKPVAIELSLPSANANHPAKQVLTPPVDATSNWLWQLAKAHVSSNDAGVHQLVQHWLRPHACMEPFIIAANRHLSKMHPIYKLLRPHMRYNLKINAQARAYLINARGIIESFFGPGKYNMEISSVAYKDWRFDMEGLPADLVRRGMAEPDSTKPCGVRLLIDDYPYASDGLLIWSAIEKMVQTYVKHYYRSSDQILSDQELQTWYNECINVGHGDHRDASWWPKLSTPEDLVSILTTIIWIVSAHHAAVNFGQYSHGAYVPIRPPSMRKLMPMEHDPEYEKFLKDPEMYYLSSLPSLVQATHYMSVLHILSTHEEDEEYLGERRDLSTWLGEPEIIGAFYNFSVELKRIEKEIEKRNSDLRLKNRCGAGVTPYKLLMPSSEPGTSGRGVPNSVCI